MAFFTFDQLAVFKQLRSKLQPVTDKYGINKYAFYSVLNFFLGLAILTVQYAYPDKPQYPYNQLVKVTGELSHLKKQPDKGQYFSVKNHPDNFQLPGPLRSKRAIHKTLTAGLGKQVTLMVKYPKREDGTPRPLKYYDVYELHIEDSIVFSYEKTMKDLAGHDTFLIIFGSVFTISGVVMWRIRRFLGDNV